MSKYVDLSERVTATYYDQECEEWTQKTVTVADILDRVCDDYTVLPSIDAVPVIRCKDCKYKEAEETGMVYCSIPTGGWVDEDWFCGDGERKES